MGKNAAIVAGAAVIGAALAFLPTGAGASDTGSISGVVLSATNGKPVGGVSVELYQDVTVDVFGSPITGPQFVTATSSGADGTYSLDGLAAAGPDGYFVCFDTFGSDESAYDSQCFADRPGFAPFADPFGFVQLPDGTSPIHLAAGGQVTGIDADLVNRRQLTPLDSGGIAGTVRKNASGAPLRGIVVTAFNANNRIFGQAVTGADGTYEIDNLPAVPVGYQVCFDANKAHGASPPAKFRSECFDQVKWTGVTPPSGATRVRVRHGAVTGGVDAALPR